MMRFPAECGQSREGIPQTMCCGVPASRGQMEEGHPVRKATRQGVPEAGGGAILGRESPRREGAPSRAQAVAAAELSAVMTMEKGLEV